MKSMSLALEFIHLAYLYDLYTKNGDWDSKKNKTYLPADYLIAIIKVIKYIYIYIHSRHVNIWLRLIGEITIHSQCKFN